MTKNQLPKLLTTPIPNNHRLSLSQVISIPEIKCISHKVEKSRRETIDFSLSMEGSNDEIEPVKSLNR